MLNTTWFTVPSHQAKVMQYWFDRDCGKSKAIAELPLVSITPDPEMDWKFKVKEQTSFPQTPPLSSPSLSFSSSLSLPTLFKCCPEDTQQVASTKLLVPVPGV